MMITIAQIIDYAEFLRREERAKGTIQKYIRDLKALAQFLGGEALNQERAAEWKAYLMEQGYASRTINSMLAEVEAVVLLALQRPAPLPPAQVPTVLLTRRAR